MAATVPTPLNYKFESSYRVQPPLSVFMFVLFLSFFTQYRGVTINNCVLVLAYRSCVRFVCLIFARLIFALVHLVLVFVLVCLVLSCCFCLSCFSRHFGLFQAFVM